MPSISVVIPAYNQPQMLAHALRGVRGQTVAPIETIVVDDCSEQPLERTTDVPPGLPARFIRHAENTGPAGSVAHGIRAARGELISILNHDDVWEPRFLERLGDALNVHPEASFAFCDHGVMLADARPDERLSHEQSRRFGRLGLQTGLLTGAQLYKAALQDKAVAASSFTLVRRAALDLRLIEAGGDSWDYFLGVGACGAGDAAAYVGERLGWYRLSPTMLTTTWSDPRKQIEMARQQIAILLVILRSPKFAPVHGDARRRLVVAIRHALMAAVRTRSPRSLGTVAVRMREGARDAQRIVPG
jgi:glycosyltransferase involved in cell wall biosynthesis